MLKLNANLKTSGQGMWSGVAATVNITELELIRKGGEVRVFFDTKTWDTSEHGLIYTDHVWLRGLREHLVAKGFTRDAVAQLGYSEQGMQGDDYVPLDAGPLFIEEFNKAA